MAAPIVMVHGAFCGGWAFDDFRTPFEKAGHTCVAPDLPGHQTGGLVAGLSMSDYARAVAKAIADCAEPPILIGHSLGGLVAQMVAARTPVSGLILLAPSSPWGVAADSTAAAAVAIGLIGQGAPWSGVIDPDRGLAMTYGLDKMPSDKAAAVIAQMRPESARALFETFNWWFDPLMTTHVPAPLKAPVFAIAGAKDTVHPVSSVQLTAGRLKASTMVMPKMSHWLIGEPGWEDVAEASLAWISERRCEAA